MLGQKIMKVKMTDFTKILDKAKELESKMKESQEKIKNIQVEGTAGSNSIKVTLNGENEMIKIYLSEEVMKEDKVIIEDLIVAAHNNAKSELMSKTSENFQNPQVDLVLLVLMATLIECKILTK